MKNIFIVNRMDSIIIHQSSPKEPKLGQNKDSPMGWLGHMAGDFIFVLSAFWLLWSSRTHIREFSDSIV